MFIINIIILSLTTCIDSFLVCFFKNNKKKSDYFFIPATFSIFQSIFLLSGYFLGDFMENYFQNYLKYIIFIIFSSMSIRLIVDVFINKEKKQKHNFSFKEIFLLSIITSCDSLFLGVPLSFKTNSYIVLILVVSLTTFTVCLLGLILKNNLKREYDETIQIIGSIVLFIFAFKSLI